MSSANVIDINDSRRFAHLKRRTAIEYGRANALDLLVKGKPLHDVLNQLVYSLESSTEGLRCSVNLLDHSKMYLSPFVGPSLPSIFLETIENLRLTPETGACGQSLHKRELIVCDDVLNDPHWRPFRNVLIESDISACWSQPIIAPDNEIYGTFCMYFSAPSFPDQDDIDSLMYEAQIIALILERAKNIDQLRRSNAKLEQRVAERTKELTESNELLRKALEQRNEVQNQLVEMENMASLGTMMSSLTHEINTPVGVAITAVSHLRTIQEQVYDAYQDGQLKRSELHRFIGESKESAEIIERNLVRSTQLIKTFKQLSIDQHSQDLRKINLISYANEILLSLKPRLKRSLLQFCLDIDPSLTIVSNPGAVGQLLINLILNSAQHGFEDNQRGQVTIGVKLLHEIEHEPMLQIKYKDNGKGMSHHTVENIYKPFFTSARHIGGSGLGMHVCYNLVAKVLEGHIDCRSTIGKGVEFTITFPVQA